MTRNIRVVALPKEEFRPWWAQRLAMRECLNNRNVIGATGRQIGKTVLGSYVMTQRAGLRPGGASMLLVPTYAQSLQPLEWLEKFARYLGGSYNKVDKKLSYANGHILWVRSTERKDDGKGASARSLTINTTLWEDEAAMIDPKGEDAALGCMATAKKWLLLKTSTPKGSTNQRLHKEWTSDKPPRPGRFYARTIDSPYVSPEIVEILRSRMSGPMGSQELDAVFIDGSIQPFSHDVVERLLSPTPIAPRGSHVSLGVDLAKEVDWCVVTRMNEHGEGIVLARWQHLGWPSTTERVYHLILANDAVAVMDRSGPGAVVYDYCLEKVGQARLVGIKTASPGAKAEICEALMRDAEFGALRVFAGDHDSVMRHELLAFQRIREVKGGQEIIHYEGPQDGGPDDHDDCVISLALANWGRLHYMLPNFTGDMTAFAVSLRKQARKEGVNLSAPLHAKGLKAPWKGGFR